MEKFPEDTPPIFSNTTFDYISPVYENMFKLMTRTIDDAKQEEIVRKMERYVYDGAYGLFIYSPLALYAVNKEIKFIPYENGSLNLKETSVAENHWSLRGKNNWVGDVDVFPKKPAQ